MKILKSKPHRQRESAEMINKLDLGYEFQNVTDGVFEVVFRLDVPLDESGGPT